MPNQTKTKKNFHGTQVYGTRVPKRRYRDLKRHYKV